MILNSLCCAARTPLTLLSTPRTPTTIQTAILIETKLVGNLFLAFINELVFHFHNFLTILLTFLTGKWKMFYWVNNLKEKNVCAVEDFSLLKQQPNAKWPTPTLLFYIYIISCSKHVFRRVYAKKSNWKCVCVWTACSWIRVWRPEMWVYFTLYFTTLQSYLLHMYLSIYADIKCEVVSG